MIEDRRQKTQGKRKTYIEYIVILVVGIMAGLIFQQYLGSGLFSRNHVILDKSETQIDDLRCLDVLLVNLRKKAKYDTIGTGEYRKVGGHHPLAKSAFQKNQMYDEDLVFTVSESTLESYGESETHRDISGHQNRLYKLYSNQNPGKRLTIEKLVEIEILSMYYAGINDSIATGWVILALEDLKKKGVTEITNIPWKGENPTGDEIIGLDRNCW